MKDSFLEDPFDVLEKLGIHVSGNIPREERQKIRQTFQETFQQIFKDSHLERLGIKTTFDQ